ncbi:uncharacterized protein LOC143021901 [Oratosquilla oratoria]|uniref:uncharacterized protein LOC143021901 n=1 Tax=Oratosquilla oratoria TaxID=337810 RepID=UPI003F757A1A
MGFYDTFRYTIAPPILLVTTTLGVQFLAVVGGHDGTSFSVFGDAASWAVVAVFMLWALLSLWVPSKQFNGPITSFGYTPRYSANGFQYFCVSFVVFMALLWKWPGIAELLVDRFPQILAVCNIAAFILCIFLLVKGKVTPQSSEVVEPMPLTYEFYRGMEVHPRLLGVDVKQLTNCRFGLMAWLLLVTAFCVVGWMRNGVTVAHGVVAILQIIYLAKFYLWETGYFDTLDITLDRAGYYICWGCMVWVPAFYTYSSYYLVANKPVISDAFALVILLVGLSAIAMNYRIDWEKEYFRKHDGNCHLWGRKVSYIEATYESSTGMRRSKLLTSGLWGIARKLNYVFEILAATCWCLPGLGLGIWPFLYAIFLTVLLVHRVFRDEEKCSAKYGQYWKEYCKVVPYRMIPGIF